MIITDEEKKALIHWHVERIRFVIDSINFNKKDDDFMEDLDEDIREINRHRISISELKREEE